MLFTSLHLVNFRNYTSQKLGLHPQLNVFCGENGSGKTNILDALHYVCLGKSYFTSSDKLVIRQSAEFFRVEAALEEGVNREKITIKMKQGGRKELEISGKKIDRLSDFIGRFLCVIIAPDDIHLMLEGSEQRRNFINNTLVQTDHAYLQHLVRYTDLLKQRNSALKSFADRQYFDALLLESITAGMDEPARYIHKARTEAINRLAPLFEEAYNDISGQKEQCSITYESQLATDTLPALMQRHLDRDRILCRTTQGIHKDDLLFAMNGAPLRDFASQGQLKSFVLALKMAQYTMLGQLTGRKPVFLLDDIFDKLDQHRVVHLIQMLTRSHFGQIFITEPSRQRMEQVLTQVSSGYSLFEIADGEVVEHIKL